MSLLWSSYIVKKLQFNFFKQKNGLKYFLLNRLSFHLKTLNHEHIFHNKN